ncbi:uncharacterized protein LOC125671577 [Ostrea edulis]|uniref:uncharacterized protein LOC125671577 n=1 Tax=Ostrea edulis TaxID=37623 RepID=UPI0024AF4803|nr:uncharacterized protein LOC125671577 [Ostrea edulis]
MDCYPRGTLEIERVQRLHHLKDNCGNIQNMKKMYCLVLILYLVSRTVLAVKNCKISSEGMDYRGNISTTVSGKSCQRWDSQTPNSHDYADTLPGNASYHENYCRNPWAGEVAGPWCYTMDNDTRWELCDIPYCARDCKKTKEGLEYSGNISITNSGKICQRWDRQSPWTHKYNTILKGNVSMHENYCRNPKVGEADGPWCYTTDAKKRWELCDIPFCDKAECLHSVMGLEYFGTEAKTEDGIDCQRWDKQEPHTHMFSSGFMGFVSSEHENYCRNPDYDEKPWCYTVNATVRYQYCDIQQCDYKDCRDTEKGMKYRGKINVTKDGTPCQHWDSTYPHLPNERVRSLGSTLFKEKNYCRNPDDEPFPWCYTMDINIRWQFCDIPFCVNSSFQCDFSQGICDLEQLNDTEASWVVNKSADDESLALRLLVNRHTSQSLLPSLRSHLLRSVDTGSCLQLEYRSVGIQLKIGITSHTLTELPESREWKTAKINIRPQLQNYKVYFSPYTTESSTELAIRYIAVLNGPCEDCFACLSDGLCIEYSGFCNMNVDCADYSDEKYCALECYHENVYQGFREETKFFHKCRESTCRFDKQSKEKPGCFVNSEDEWVICSIPECEKGNLDCDFQHDMCNWKQMLPGIKWNRQIAEHIGEMVTTAEWKTFLNDSVEERAVLYSTSQPSSSDFGCVTMTYSGENVNLNVFVSQGTILTNDVSVFQRQNIDTKMFATTSFQTPIAVPYMVIVMATIQDSAARTGNIQIGKLSYLQGLCKDKDACQKSQFQCDDGSCVGVDQFCNEKRNCPNGEDESLCKYNNSVCLRTESDCILPCPSYCECQGLVFKCKSPDNVTKEARALDFSSNKFDNTQLKNFTFLIHLNISRCSKDDFSLKDLGDQLQSPSLQNLDLSFNNIRHLEPGTFKGLSNLLYLNISYNQVNRFEMDFLNVIPKLRRLIMKDNNIKLIPAKEIYSDFNSSLEFIDLRNNKIRRIMPKSLYWLGSISKLDLSNNSITNTDNYFSSSMKMLFELDLSFNSITVITNEMFNGLQRLRELNLQSNHIEILQAFSFSTLTSLRTLNLGYNKIHTIDRKAMENMVSLTKLNLTGNRLMTLSSSRFIALVKLHILDLSNNGMSILEDNAFQRLEEVKSLYIHNNQLSVSKTMFQGLCNLHWLRTDSYIICCAKPLSVDTSNCISPRDRISSCEQLINVGFLAQMIWYMAFFSLIGNTYVIYYRIKETLGRNNKLQGVFILNLSFSDLLMGVYLYIIAVADLEYRNIYGFKDSEWRSSIACTIAGLLATISSEASVLFVFLITVERYLALKYPFSEGFLKKRKGIYGITIIVWIITFIFAVFPLSVYPDFYSRSTVCISLPLTAERVQGWEYSTFVFIGFNLLIFIAVVVGQILIYVKVKRIGSAIHKDNTKREIAVMKSLSYVVLSDTFCWIPIILIGIMVYAGLDISFNVYAWVVVLVLPINSALNPFIYTFSMIYRKNLQARNSQMVMSNKERIGHSSIKSTVI